MNVRTMSRRLMQAAALTVLSVSSAGAENLLQNPDFENVNPAISADWTNTLYSTAWKVPAGHTAFHENWAWFSLGYGGVFYGWSPGDSPGGIYQDVDVGPGTYTFELWIKFETDANPTNAQLRMQFYDASTNLLQSAVTNVEALAHDNQFHRKYVTATCTSNNLAFVRVGYYVYYGAPLGGGGQAIPFDAAALYTGSFQGERLQNNSLEEGQSSSIDGTKWVRSSATANHRPNWATRSGSNGGWALEGYTGPGPDYAISLSQRVYPKGTGTYNFAAWVKRESTNMFLTNVTLSVSWWDGAASNQVSDTISASYTNIPGDNNFYQYVVEGVLTNEACGEAIVTLTGNWGYNSDGAAPGRAGMVDDFTFRAGSTNDNTVNIDYAYFAPSFEAIPGTTNLWTFLQVNYETTQTIYRLITDTELSLSASETGTVGIKVTYQDPESLSYLDTWAAMTRIGQAVIDSSAPFYGRPASGSHTVDVWQYVATQPLATNGVPYTNHMAVFASPFLRTLQGIVETESWYLSPNSTSGARTNSYAGDVQYFVPSFFGADYASWNIRLPAFTTLSNGGFEEINGQLALTNTGWQFSRSAGRDTWPARLGNYGAFLPGWQNGLERLFQYVATTGGTYTFSMWMLAENGFNDNYTKLGLLWYNSSHQLLQRDEFDLTSLPSDKVWHPAYVSGTCVIPGTAYVVPYLESRFFGAANGAVFVDDFELYSGSYTGSSRTLRNTSFETRVGDNGWRGAEGWMTNPESSGGSTASERKDWAWYTGARGVALISYPGEGGVPGSNYQMTITQVVTPGTGTYTFSSRMRREANSAFSNAALRLEWYDRSLTNQVQAATVTNFVVPADSAWREYYVTGTCADTNLFEVRCVIYAQWGVNAISPGPGEAAMIDDVHFNAGTYENHLNLEYAYHNAIASNRFEQLAPGAYGTFVDVDYATSTTTFRVVAPQNLALRSDESSSAKIKVTYQHPVTGNYLDVFADMTLEGPAVITAGSPFHGLPASGSVTVNVWKYDWPMPRDAGEPPFTNAITVYYAPYVVATLSNSPNARQEDLKYLTTTGTLNNAYSPPQYFSDNFFGVDFSYTNVFTTNTCVDCDNDGLPDWWEILKFGAVTNDASGDHDGDGFDNNEEYAADTDPYSNASFFQPVSVNTSATKSIIIMRIPGSSTGRVYDAYWKTNLVDGGSVWTAYGLNVQGNGGTLTITVTNQPGTNVFFRAGARP
jgi:hypothetical protein